MKRIVILGGGTAGTIMTNKLREALERNEWEITLVDKDKTHYYQPGFLLYLLRFIKKQDVIKPKMDFIPAGIDMIFSEIDRIDAENNQVILHDDKHIKYDILIIATGTDIRPEETPGLKDKLWYNKIFDFYSLDGALALRDFLRGWDGGTMVVNIVDVPHKCPVAPLEFSFLADEFFTKKGIRNKVNIKYVTPQAGAFTKPRANKMLSGLLEEKNIEIIPDFYIDRVDNDKSSIIAYDGREIPFDLLTVVPLNMGSDAIGRSGLGDDLNYIPTNKYTLQSEKFENIFVIGDAANLPTSKAGAVAHFSSDILFENIMSFIEGRPLRAKFDGHANCYIETGYGKGSLIDFNYETEPLPGTFPLPGVGPFGLLKNTKMNHYGKIMFRWMYWHLLLPGKELPIEPLMTMAGKCEKC